VIYHFNDPERAVRTMRRRGYLIVQDRASGVIFRKTDRYVHLAPDGAALALASEYVPCRLASWELGESTEKVVLR
jgi:hypothetical protein